MEDTMTHDLEQSVRVPLQHAAIDGNLRIPANALAVVTFAHGSGSGRFSPRNQFVALALQSAGLGTLLMDLLGEDEEDDREKVFDIELLAGRLQSAADWLRAQPKTQGCRLGYFGASTGAAAALVAVPHTS